MLPYGNEHTYQIDLLNSSKRHPNLTSSTRRSTRRAYRHRRRALDKRALRREVSHG